MMIRAALEPGTSPVNRHLMCAAGGQNHFSLTVRSAAADIRYGDLLTLLEVHHNVTLIAMADSSAGKGLRPNASKDAVVRRGAVLDDIAARRIDVTQVRWQRVAGS